MNAFRPRETHPLGTAAAAFPCTCQVPAAGATWSFAAQPDRAKPIVQSRIHFLWVTGLIPPAPFLAAQYDVKRAGEGYLVHSYRVGRRASLGAKQQLFKRYVAGNFGLVEMGAGRMVSRPLFPRKAFPTKRVPAKLAP